MARFTRFISLAVIFRGSVVVFVNSRCATTSSAPARFSFERASEKRVSDDSRSTRQQLWSPVDIAGLGKEEIMRAPLALFQIVPGFRRNTVNLQITADCSNVKLVIFYLVSYLFMN